MDYLSFCFCNDFYRFAYLTTVLDLVANCRWLIGLLIWVCSFLVMFLQLQLMIWVIFTWKNQYIISFDNDWPLSEIWTIFCLCVCTYENEHYRTCIFSLHNWSMNVHLWNDLGLLWLKSLDQISLPWKSTCTLKNITKSFYTFCFLILYRLPHLSSNTWKRRFPDFSD